MYYLQYIPRLLSDFETDVLDIVVTVGKLVMCAPLKLLL